ncbi:MAG: Na+/H+ antiporter subunit C [Pseudomonadota bacterium]
MEIIVASSIGVLAAGGVYLLLRLRTFPVILGLTLLSYAVNVFIFASGRLAIDQSPILSPYAYGDTTYTDPLPQALVLTAIVISFGMTAVLVMIGLAAHLESDSDRINIAPEEDDVHTTPEPEGRA